MRPGDIGDSEDETFWTGFLRSLKARGLGGVRLVISDAHAGLRAAIRRVLSGASWQRCRVHYARNLLALVPKAHQEMVSAAFRSIFALADPDDVRARYDEVTDTLTARFPKAAECRKLIGFPCSLPSLVPYPQHSPVRLDRI